MKAGGGTPENGFGYPIVYDCDAYGGTIRVSRLHATVEISAVNGVFTLFDHKIIDI